MKPSLLLTLGLLLAAGSNHAATIQEIADKTNATENKAPAWIKHGAYVYRICTPDNADFLGFTEEGIGITSHLLDNSIAQIPLINGLISDDHNGVCNWDGIWPYWNHVSYRAKNWDNLSGFMKRVNDKYNTKVSFHVNLTDVNVGLNAFPETREFFKKLVATKSIYRRDRNPSTNKRDVEPPYVPQDIITEKNDSSITIFALVNYNQFWKSGLAKDMIADFYGHLPYAPPVLYIDVLTAEGGNFSTGYPDGPLGGSKETQIEGMLKISEYLRSKGTEVGTEGDRTFLKDYGTYAWLHSQPGYSSDDYSKIKGAAKGPRVPIQHVMGNTGCFVVSPVGSSQEQITKVRGHYSELLAGAPITRKMPGLDTWHIADRGSDSDEFNMFPNGGGDPFRGDWIDLVNGFYLSGIQELYHIGKGNVRTNVYQKIAVLHLRKFVITDPKGNVTEIPVGDCIAPGSYPESTIKEIRKNNRLMFERPLLFHFNAPVAGKYPLAAWITIPGRGPGGMNVYVNGERQLSVLDVTDKVRNDFSSSDLGELTLKAGDNTITVDSGPIYAKWSDGTEAIWETPSLHKGFKVSNGDVTFAYDYDRMWPDTWSGQKKIYFYSWDGTDRTWKLPTDWADAKTATLYPLTPDGRGKGMTVPIKDRSLSPKLLPQVPYILVPEAP